MEIAISLFASAKKDLKAASGLYELELFPQSITAFQQAVEKSNKACALSCGIIAPQELHGEIKHNALAIYEKILSYRKNELDKTLKIAWQHPYVRSHKYFREIWNYRANVIGGQSFLSKFRKDDFFRLKEDDLFYILDQLDEIRNSTKDIPADIAPILEPAMQGYLDFLNGLNNMQADGKRSEIIATLNDDQEYLETAEIIRKLLHVVVETAYVDHVLYLMALITIPHATTSRYPMIYPRFDPNKFYNRRVPLVNLLPEFLKHLKRAFRIVEKINPEITGKKYSYDLVK